MWNCTEYEKVAPDFGNEHNKREELNQKSNRMDATLIHGLLPNEWRNKWTDDVGSVGFASFS